MENAPFNGKITVSSLVWFALTLSTCIILAMAGAWASQVNTHTTMVEQRLNVVEQNFGTVMGQLQDLRDNQKEMNAKLDQMIEGRK